MTQPRGRIVMRRLPVPLWLVLAVLAPLSLVFLTSLVLAVVIIAGAAALMSLVLPLFSPRRPFDRLRSESQNTIELDPADYRRIDSRRRDER